MGYKTAPHFIFSWKMGRLLKLIKAWQHNYFQKKKSRKIIYFCVFADDLFYFLFNSQIFFWFFQKKKFFLLFLRITMKKKKKKNRNFWLTVAEVTCQDFFLGVRHADIFIDSRQVAILWFRPSFPRQKLHLFDVRRCLLNKVTIKRLLFKKKKKKAVQHWLL